MKTKQKDLVKCDECKHLIREEDAQFVEHVSSTRYMPGGEMMVRKAYCPEHRKNYTRELNHRGFTSFYKECEAYENGSLRAPYGKKIIDLERYHELMGRLSAGGVYVMMMVASLIGILVMIPWI